jgi:hypothetical protein
LGNCKQRHALRIIAIRDQVIAVETILEIRHPCCPRDGAEAAAAQHERAEPSVQPPTVLPLFLLHPTPRVQRAAARQGAHAIRRNLHVDVMLQWGV